MRIISVFYTYYSHSVHSCERNVRKSVHKTQKNDIIQAKVDEGDTDNTDAAASHRKDGISYFVCTRVLSYQKGNAIFSVGSRRICVIGISLAHFSLDYRGPNAGPEWPSVAPSGPWWPQVAPSGPKNRREIPPARDRC